MSLLKGEIITNHLHTLNFTINGINTKKVTGYHQKFPMHDDVNDWKKSFERQPKRFLTNIFRFFTQGDVDVASAYYTQYLPFFKLPEVTMMMGGFAGREGVHIDAYSYLWKH